MRGSGQRLPITLRFTRVLGTFSHTTCFPFSCALWACFSDRSVSGERSEPIGALMPHAALWVVQLLMATSDTERHWSFNAARGFVGGAAPADGSNSRFGTLFQCRTRLCGWCSLMEIRNCTPHTVFQCRTRLFPFAPTTASRSPSPARAGEAFRLRHAGFSSRCAEPRLLQSSVAT